MGWLSEKWPWLAVGLAWALLGWLLPWAYFRSPRLRLGHVWAILLILLGGPLAWHRATVCTLRWSALRAQRTQDEHDQLLREIMDARDTERSLTGPEA